MQKVILKSFMCLRPVYKDELQKWLRAHIKKGVKYTYMVRGQTIDEYGYTHLLEREYCPPVTLKDEAELVTLGNSLPYLSEKKMNKLFKEAGLPLVDFKELATVCSPMYRVMLYMRDSGWIK